MNNIPFAKPDLSRSDVGPLEEILEGGTLVHGKVTRQFEEEFAHRVGSEYAISVSSCTAALHLSLMAHDVGPGQSVLVPAMTHVATAHAVEFCGAIPIFADVDPATGNIDPLSIAQAIRPNTTAIIVVHYLGLPCDMDSIRSIAGSSNIKVIEDCALALGATYKGRQVGTLGDAGCFSFYPTKHMTTIEGGMVTTNDTALAERVRKQKAFGYDRSVEQRNLPGIYDVTMLGYNYRMNEVEAAIGLQQLKRLDNFQEARRRNWERLAAQLVGREDLVIFPRSLGSSDSSHFCLNVTFSEEASIDRNTVLMRLKEAGVGCSVHYPVALPLSHYYRHRYGYRLGEFPTAEWIAAETLSLPVGPHLVEGDIERIAQTLVDVLGASRQR